MEHNDSSMEEKAMEQKRKLLTYTKSERNVYLLSMLGQNITYNIIGAGLAYYLQFTILIPAMTVGIIMTLARVWDAVNDFMMGTIVDKTRTKWGKCRPYLIFIPLPIYIFTVLCFTNFGFYEIGGNAARNALIVGWAAFTYVLYGMTYTIGDIPLWGVTALMTEDDKDRNKLLSLARIAGDFGGGVILLLILPVALAISGKLAETMGGPNGERYGFLVTVLIFGFVGYVLFQLCGFKIRERIPSSKKKYTMKENFKIIWGNKPFRQILLSGILGSPKMLIALAVMPLVTYYFASKDSTQALIYLVVLGGGYFIGNFVAMAFTPRMICRFSKKRLYNGSNLLSALPFALIFVLYRIAPRGALASSPVYVAVLCVLFAVCGGATGVTIVLQSAMIADCVDFEEYKNGTRPDGVFFSGQTFLAKLTTGIATILSAAAYAYVGFSDEKVDALNRYIENMGPDDLLPRLNPEYDSIMMILFFLISIPPAIGCILSVIPTLKYALNDDVHDVILRELNERRQLSEKELLPDMAVSDDSSAKEND